MSRTCPTCDANETTVTRWRMGMKVGWLPASTVARLKRSIASRPWYRLEWICEDCAINGAAPMSSLELRAKDEAEEAAAEEQHLNENHKGGEK